MEPNTSSAPKRQPHYLTVLLAIFLLFSISFWYYYPSFQEAPINTEDWTLVYQGQLYPGQALIQNDNILVSFSFLQEYLDPALFWDQGENAVVITTQDKQIIMGTDQLTAYINHKPVGISVPLVLIDELPFLPMEILSEIYPIKIAVAESNKRIILEKLNEPFVAGTVIADKAYLRQNAHLRSPRIHTVAKDEEVIILKEENGFFMARTAAGIIGFLDKRKVKYAGIILEKQPETTRISWKPLGGKINLTWEYVNKRTTAPADIGELAGVNVVSPTWFHLKDQAGNLENNADLNYVHWAHEKGYQVWGLITNRFDRDLTNAVLSSTDKRQKVIDQLLVFAQLYHLDGLNIDFENMHLKDKDLLTQFMRELTPLAHEQGLTVSIAVTIRSTSENWSMIYDRAALGEIVDYMAVMTYDEHWASSPKAGSVASLPWVERGLVGVLEQVPQAKVLLGIPFYTRIWEEEKQPDGSLKVSSKALSMEAAENLIAKNKVQIKYDDKAQQDYAEWTNNNTTFKIWLENESSIAKRVQLAKKYDLAGVASWRRGFEKQSIWPVIEVELNRY